MNLSLGNYSGSEKHEKLCRINLISLTAEMLLCEDSHRGLSEITWTGFLGTYFTPSPLPPWLTILLNNPFKYCDHFMNTPPPYRLLFVHVVFVHSHRKHCFTHYGLSEA